MAVKPNRIEGELVINHEAKPYRLRFDFNVMADFEELTSGRDIMAALSPKDGASPSMADLRTVFWMCFAAYHPEVTKREAGRIYSADTTVLERLIKLCMPEPATDAASDGEPGNGQAVKAA